MKNLFLTAVFMMAAVLAAQAQNKPTPSPVKPAPAPAPAPAPTTPAPSGEQSEIQFVDESHDFGNIKEGTQATYEFKFKNTGTAPLILTNVQASCGCTTPNWSREPIAPGKTGTITATYNSNGRPGTFTKNITVTSNAKTATKVLTIRGFVEANAPAQTQPQSPVVNPGSPAKP